MILTAPKADVFIAYKREDRALVDRISTALKASGHTVVTDFDVPPAANFGDAIETMIRQAKLVLVVWTAAAMKSPWVKAEAQLAFSLGRYIGLRLEDLDPPFMLAGEQMIVPADASLHVAEMARVVEQVKARLSPGARLPVEAGDSLEASAGLQRAALEQGAWQIALKAGKPADFEKFLRLHPVGFYAREAQVALASAQTVFGKAKRVLGIPQLAGLMAVLGVIVAILAWNDSPSLIPDAVAVVPETVATVEATNLEPARVDDTDELASQATVEPVADTPVEPFGSLAVEPAAPVAQATMESGEWPLRLTKDEQGLLLGKYACGHGVMIGGGCVDRAVTNIKLNSLDGIAALPLLQKLKSVKFDTSNLSGMSASDWATLRYLPALTKLELGATNFGNLRQISGLEGLTYLDISDTDVRDLLPLATLTALTTLLCAGNQIKDISALSALHGLSGVSLNWNSDLASIEALAGAENLQQLYIRDTNVSDLSPLNGKLKLSSLDLAKSNADNISPLADLPKLDLLILANGYEYLSRAEVEALLAPLRTTP